MKSRSGAAPVHVAARSLDACAAATLTLTLSLSLLSRSMELQGEARRPVAEAISDRPASLEVCAAMLCYVSNCESA